MSNKFNNRTLEASVASNAAHLGARYVGLSQQTNHGNDHVVDHGNSGGASVSYGAGGNVGQLAGTY